jgi:hypothetical protein
MKMSWDVPPEERVKPDYEAIVCGECGLRFTVPRVWVDQRRNDHRTFYCMNGHPMSYTGESEREKLRRERDRLRQQLAEKDDTIKHWANAAEKERKAAIAAKGTVTKLRKRVGNGACPCCNRSFTDLRRHMETQHPEFKAEAAE